MVLALLFGIALGVTAALNQNRLTDHSIMSIAMIGITIPNFVTAPLLTLVFGVYGLHLFGIDLVPAGCGLERRRAAQHDAAGHRARPAADRHHRATDARQHGRGAALQLRPHGARQGPARHVIVTRHALRAALLPLVSYLGPAIAELVTGSLIVEQIFGLPGIGRYFVQAAVNRDYTLVMGVVIFYAALIIVLNLLADLLYGVLDPRVSYRA